MSDYAPSIERLWEAMPLGQVSTKERERAAQPAKPAAGNGVQPVQRSEAGHSSVRPMRKPRVSSAAEKHRAREHDAITSHEAGAKHARNAAHYELIKQALRLGPAGQLEIARRVGVLDNAAVSRPLKEMRDRHEVEHTGRKVINAKGNSEYEYRLVAG